MLTLEFVSDYVFQHFPKVTVSKNGTHFTARCILCGDSKKSLSKKRFNLDWNNGRPIYHCFNCGESGSFLDLYSRLEGVSKKQAYEILYKHDVSSYSSESIKDKINGTKENDISKSKYLIFNDVLNDCLGPYDITNSYVTQKFQNYLLTFIKDRSIPEDIKLFVAVKGKYKGRIIIPVYDSYENIIYFQARAINDSIKPKYLNPKVDKQNIIYNLENFQRDKYIIVSEGLLDAFMVPNQGTACLGSNISDDLIKILLSKTDEGIVLAFDNDKPGTDSMIKFMKTSKYSNIVFYFLYPNKYSVETDLNLLVSKHKVKDIYKLIIDNKFTRVSAETKLRLRRKLL